MSQPLETAVNGRYQLIAKLGQGGMARVHLVLSRSQVGVSKLLVVKEMLPGLQEDAEICAMFLDEGRLAARLNHPNVIQTYDVYVEGEYPVIVMEYLEGQSLAATLQRVGRDQVPLSVVLHILIQVLSGLHYAHELCDFDGTPLGLVHRDVSPHNVFVTYDGHVKLLDFGIAKAVNSESRTRTGVFKGKLGYASPEQIERAPLDRRSDIFAVGVMLWEAIAQRRIMTGEIDVAAMTRRINGDEPKILEVVPETPVELARICDKAMAVDRDDRFATAEEFRAALAAYDETSHRASVEQVAKLMCRSFAIDRAKIRATIEARVKAMGARADAAPSSRTRPPPALPAEPTSPAEDTAPTASTRERMALTSDPGDPPVATVTQRSRWSPARAPILLAIGALGAAVLFMLRAPRQPTVNGAAVATNMADAAAATVSVTIGADPPTARIFLDDAELPGNPFHGVLPQRSQSQRVRTVAPGFITDERQVLLEHDLQLYVQLRQAPPEPSTSAAPPAPLTPTMPAPAWRPLLRPAADAAAPTTPYPSATPPGDPARGGRHDNPRPIDEKF